MHDKFDSKLGSMNAVDDINAKEVSNYQLSGTTKRVIDAYKSAQEGEKSKAVENFYKKDKVGKQYMKDFNEKRMGRQSDYFKEVTQLKNRGYDISRMAYRKEGKTIVE